MVFFPHVQPSHTTTKTFHKIPKPKRDNKNYKKCQIFKLECEMTRKIK